MLSVHLSGESGPMQGWQGEESCAQQQEQRGLAHPHGPVSYALYDTDTAG